LQADTPYGVRRLESWAQFLEVITDTQYSDWAFRGHRNQQWPLLSALSRYLRNFRVDPGVWAAQEQRILRIFKRKAHHFLSAGPLPDDDFEWLALMQHYGLPTRLLDWTESVLVAAYFAVCDENHADKNGKIWILNPGKLRASNKMNF